MSNAKDIQPCPKCGSKEVLYSYWTDQIGNVGPGCFRCGHVEGTLEEWNRKSDVVAKLIRENQDSELQDKEQDTVEAGKITRELCKMCGCISRVGFSVSDRMWKIVVPEQHRQHVLCIACFTMLADEQLVPWDRSMEFYPVSFLTHLDESLPSADAEDYEYRGG